MNADEIVRGLRSAALDAEDTSRAIAAVLEANQRSRDRVSVAWLNALVSQIGGRA